MNKSFLPKRNGANYFFCQFCEQAIFLRKKHPPSLVLNGRPLSFTVMTAWSGGGGGGWWWSTYRPSFSPSSITETQFRQFSRLQKLSLVNYRNSV